ncbi:MAG: hypothetical protein RL510_966, partial [Actinomycetota bacterium]
MRADEVVNHSYGSEGWGFESLQAHKNPVSSHESRVFTYSPIKPPIGSQTP